jgi:hypothetical protein
MRKGFFASVAALATGAGVAYAQPGPAGPPPAAGGYPAWPGPAVRGAVPGAAPGIPGDPNAFLGAPGGYPAGPGPMPIPPAQDMPLYGQVPGPDYPHPLNPGAQPKYGSQVGQVHKAAGGPDKWWIDVEENIWTIRSMGVPIPLLTSGPASSNGIVGAPGTTVLIGDENLERHEWFSVFRLTGGKWNCDRTWGWELSGFISEQRTLNFDTGLPATGNNVLARPIIDALTGLPTSFLVTQPGSFGGTAHVDTRFHMGGAEANVLKSLLYCDMVKANLLGGIRYIDTTEALDITSTSTLPNPNDANNPIISTVTDQFHTHNQFLGGQVGAETELRCGRLFLDATGKIALGNMHERLVVQGETISTVGTTTTAVPGGLLAVLTNSGKFSRNEFAYVPEGSVKVGWQWTQRISTYVGADFLYLSRVFRPGPQIDPVVNPTLVPVSNQFGQNFGAIRPLPILHQSDFWAGGATLGLSIRY